MVDWLLLIGFYVILLIGEMIRQSQNNIFWILRDDDYFQFRRLGLFKYDGMHTLIRKDTSEYLSKFDYIWRYRIRTVWTNIIDWSSALSSSFWFSLIIYFIIQVVLK